VLEEQHDAARRAARTLGLQPPWNPDDDVQFVAWPSGRSRREQLGRAGVPRLLVVEAGELPPDEWDDLEDWVRAPVDVEEAAYRAETLRGRLRERTAGVVVDDGLLRRGESWVHLTPTQLALTRALLGHAGRVVGREDLGAVFEEAGGTPSGVAFSSCITRLRTKLAEVDVVLHVLGEGRFLLEVAGVETPA